MVKFWIIILVSFFATNLLDKSESVDLFDEIFGEGWWDNDKAKEWDKLTLEQNFHHPIDRQNTQIGQIEPNSTDQNAPLTESDHNLNGKNDGENEIIKEIISYENIAEDHRKRKIVAKFHAIKEEFKQQGKYSAKERTKVENEIAKHLKVNRKKIYKWKKELGLTQRNPKNERKNLVEKFDQMKAELKRAGLKNSYSNQIDKTVAKELGLDFVTIYRWKRKLGQTKSNKHSHSEQKELMKHYYEIKDKNSKTSDKDIAKMLNIVSRTLRRWKKQFNPNSVNSVEKNAAANVQEIGN